MLSYSRPHLLRHMTYHQIKPGWIESTGSTQENQRIKELYRLNILDSEPEERFDLLLSLIKQLIGGEFVLLSLVDKHRQWFKSKIGLEENEHPRSWSFCAHTIEQPDHSLNVEDTLKDDRFYSNPLVINPPHIRSYLGCAIKSPTDQSIGSVCVLDTKPRQFTEKQIHELETITHIISREIWRDQLVIDEQNHLIQQTLYDPLTGLPAQQLFMHRLEAICGQKADQDFHLIVMNVQRFRVVNRMYGRIIGDQLLCELASKIQSILPLEHYLAKLRDDRFAILLRGSREQSKFLLRMNIILEQPLVPSHPNLIICCSVGVSAITPGFYNRDEVFNQANSAMRAAPELSQGVSFESYAPNQERMLVRGFEIENRLREAIKENEFEMVYQPIVQVVDGEMIGVEALIRWPWKSGQYLSPLEFIPIAEESGLIRSLTRWIIKTTCHEFSEIYEKFSTPLYLSVNISSADLLDLSFTNYILKTLNEYKLPASRLKLEVTEHSVIKDIELAVAQMQKLQEAGVWFAIDDFGTGHSSLRYLQLLPATVLKIDRSFINGVTSLERDATITRATIALAHSLNKNVIAEGVEKPEQAKFLREHDAEYAQGWFYARPVPIKELLNYHPPFDFHKSDA
ncbi:MAG: hypothetical protein CENE_03535 [Candidatus Celerinatantimonas neptuna]|nr:MAG: hypothetical protein CENE_03535 [Candidatus Celerinatantimonas neptuna]